MKSTPGRKKFRSIEKKGGKEPLRSVRRSEEGERMKDGEKTRILGKGRAHHFLFSGKIISITSSPIENCVLPPEEKGKNKLDADRRYHGGEKTAPDFVVVEEAHPKRIFSPQQRGSGLAKKGIHADKERGTHSFLHRGRCSTLAERKTGGRHQGCRKEK